MGQNGKITVGFIVVCTAAILVAIAMCALEKVQIASFIGMVATGFAVIGLYFGFESWKEKPEYKKTASQTADSTETAVQAEMPAGKEDAQESPVLSRPEEDEGGNVAQK